MRKFVAGKVPDTCVTDTKLNYPGLNAPDPDRYTEIGLLPLELEEIRNENSGARISTDVIHGVRRSRFCLLNGAAARTCQLGDDVIICNADYIDDIKFTLIAPHVLIFDPNNIFRRAAV